MSAPKNAPRKLAAYTKGYAVGFNGGDADSNPYKGKHGNWNRGFLDAWQEGWADGWRASKLARAAVAK
jgi:ribosome modulation factor